MGNKEFKARITQKIDTPENWAKATGFSPLKGEIVVYDSETPSFKIGDGKTNVNDLPEILSFTREPNSNKTIYELIEEKLANRLLPDPTQLEDGLALVVQDGKWVPGTLDVSSINGINIQVANEAPTDIEESNPTITFVV